MKERAGYKSGRQAFACAFTLFLLFALSLTGCGILHDFGDFERTGVAPEQSQEYLSPSASVTKRLEALRAQGLKEWSGLNEEGYLRSALTLVDDRIENFDYDIAAEREEGLTAEVDITIKTWSFGRAYLTAFDEVLTRVAQRALDEYATSGSEYTSDVLAKEEGELTSVLLNLSSETLSSAEAVTLFSEAFEKSFAGTQKDFSATATFYLSKDAQGKWVIEETSSHDAVIDALYGGLISAAREVRERSSDEGYLRGYVLEVQGS